MTSEDFFLDFFFFLCSFFRSRLSFFTVFCRLSRNFPTLEKLDDIEGIVSVESLLEFEDDDSELLLESSESEDESESSESDTSLYLLKGLGDFLPLRPSPL